MIDVFRGMPTQSRNLTHRRIGTRNQRTGASFESALSWESARADVLAVRNGQTVRWLPGGKTIPVKSNLDWTLLTREGHVAFVDTKSFAGRRFGRSVIDPSQLQLGLRYETFGFKAGFVVLLREINAIVFYDAKTIQGAGQARGFGIDDGLLLGRLDAFDVRKIWAVA